MISTECLLSSFTWICRGVWHHDLFCVPIGNLFVSRSPYERVRITSSMPFRYRSPAAIQCIKLEDVHDQIHIVNTSFNLFKFIPLLQVEYDCIMFPNSLEWLTAIGLLISIASASPTLLTKKTSLLEYRPSTPLSKRQSTGNVNGNNVGLDDLPTCDSDPSNAAGPSRFTDGQGISQASGCDNGKSGNSHCWFVFHLEKWDFRRLTAADCLGQTLLRSSGNMITTPGSRLVLLPMLFVRRYRLADCVCSSFRHGNRLR